MRSSAGWAGVGGGAGIQARAGRMHGRGGMHGRGAPALLRGSSYHTAVCTPDETCRKLPSDARSFQHYGNFACVCAASVAAILAATIFSGCADGKWLGGGAGGWNGLQPVLHTTPSDQSAHLLARPPSSVRAANAGQLQPHFSVLIPRTAAQQPPAEGYGALLEQLARTGALYATRNGALASGATLGRAPEGSPMALEEARIASMLADAGYKMAWVRCRARRAVRVRVEGVGFQRCVLRHCGNICPACTPYPTCPRVLQIGWRANGLGQMMSALVKGKITLYVFLCGAATYMAMVSALSAAALCTPQRGWARGLALAWHLQITQSPSHGTSSRAHGSDDRQRCKHPPLMPPLHAHVQHADRLRQYYFPALGGAEGRGPLKAHWRGLARLILGRDRGGGALVLGRPLSGALKQSVGLCLPVGSILLMSPEVSGAEPGGVLANLQHGVEGPEPSLSAFFNVVPLPRA